MKESKQKQISALSFIEGYDTHATRVCISTVIAVGCLLLLRLSTLLPIIVMQTLDWMMCPAPNGVPAVPRRLANFTYMVPRYCLEWFDPRFVFTTYLASNIAPVSTMSYDVHTKQVLYSRSEWYIPGTQAYPDAKAYNYPLNAGGSGNSRTVAQNTSATENV